MQRCINSRSMLVGIAAVFVHQSEARTVTKFDAPSLDVIGRAIAARLHGKYEAVEVEVLPNTPNLTTRGWVLPGLGTPTLLDVGSDTYLKIAKCHNSTYNITELAYTIPEISRYLPNGAWYGSAAAYRPVMGVNGELVADQSLDGSAMFSWGAFVDKKGNLSVMPMRTDSIGPFGSLFVTDGADTPVLKVTVNNLKYAEEERFDFQLYDALVDAASTIGEVGLAGVMSLSSGTVTFHVMKDFTYDRDVSPEEFASNYTNYYRVQAPLECATRIVGKRDIIDETTKGAHSHCRSQDLRHVGHYQNDTKLVGDKDRPLPILFEAFLVPARALVRVPEPVDPLCQEALRLHEEAILV